MPDGITYSISISYSWTAVGQARYGTRPQQSRRAAGLEAEGDEPAGRNDSEPHRMSLEKLKTGEQPSRCFTGEGRREKTGQPPASWQRSGGVGVGGTSVSSARESEVKTRTVNIRQTGINFLGFNLTWRRSPRGRSYLHAQPSQKEPGQFTGATGGHPQPPEAVASDP